MVESRQFSVIAPAPVYVGRIAQNFATSATAGGEDVFGWIPGRRMQAFLPVEQARRHLMLVGQARPLIQDVSVVNVPSTPGCMNA